MSAARERGWPEPAVYTDTGSCGWQRPGSDLARLAANIGRGQRDAVITADLYRVSRTPTGAAGFAEHCASHDVALRTVYDTHGRTARSSLHAYDRQQQQTTGPDDTAAHRAI